MLFYFFNRGFRQGFIVNKIPDWCFILPVESSGNIALFSSTIPLFLLGLTATTGTPSSRSSVGISILIPFCRARSIMVSTTTTGIFEVNDLGTEKQVSFQVAGIGHGHHYIGFDVFVFPDQDFITHPFIQPLGVKAVGAGQVDQYSALKLPNSAVPVFLSTVTPGKLPTC
jgi:hypothetical protein